MDDQPSAQVPKRDPQGRLLPGQTANPSGKGGFQDHPELRSDGRWSGRASVTYNMNRYKAMTNKELAVEAARMDDLTQAEQMALRSVMGSKKDTELGFKKFQDLVDRTEGKARQTIDTTVSQTEPPTINVTFK